MTFKNEHLYGIKDPNTMNGPNLLLVTPPNYPKEIEVKKIKIRYLQVMKHYMKYLCVKRISNSILKAIKETSIDCSVYSTANAREGIACYSFEVQVLKLLPEDHLFLLKKNNP